MAKKKKSSHKTSGAVSLVLALGLVGVTVVAPEAAIITVPLALALIA